MWNSGFSGDMRGAHDRARRVLEEAVANIHTVMSFSGGQKVLQLYCQQLKQPLRRSLVRGQVCGIAFGVSQFFLFACNAFLLWYGSHVLRRESNTSFPNIIKAYLVFTFTAFSLIEVFGLGPSVLKRRKSVAPVFSIINRRSQVEGLGDDAGQKPSHLVGLIEFRDLEFRFDQGSKKTHVDSGSFKQISSYSCVDGVLIFCCNYPPGTQCYQSFPC